MNMGTGGSSVSPGSGWQSSGAVVSISAAAAGDYSFSSWTGSGPGSYSGSSSSSSVTMNGPITETASFTVWAPEITQQPQSQTVLPGTNVTFSVVASGTPPFSYQWWFNGNPIPGETNAILQLSDVQLMNAGDYGVAITSLCGWVASSNATLTVLTEIKISGITVRNGQITIAWTGGKSLFRLQKKANLSDSFWQDAGDSITENSVTVPTTSASGFYRIIRP